MNSLLIARRDLSAYLHSWTGYIIIAAVLFIDGVLFNAFAMGTSARYSHEVLEDFFYFSSGMVIIASILLTMGSITEERTSGTLVILQTSPITEMEIILGKFLSAIAMIAILTGLTIYMPALIFVNGKVSLAHIAVGYLGLMSVGAATSAIGIFGSSLFKSPMASAILSAVITVTLLTAWILSQVTDPPFSEILSYAALFDKHFVPFMEGRFNSSSLVYYASVTGIFLFGASHVLSGRRWE
jgi:ABC-2 type transport system permease protein